MTDKELLEYAAKAAGMNVSWDHYEPDLAAIAEGMFLNGERSPDNSKYWNPLTDDGDALRLAHTAPMIVTPGTARLLDGRLFGADNNDIAATRRAITRAAAEIGKGVVQPVSDDLPEDNYYKSMAEAEETGRAVKIGKKL